MSRLVPGGRPRSGPPAACKAAALRPHKLSRLPHRSACSSKRTGAGTAHRSVPSFDTTAWCGWELAMQRTTMAIGTVKWFNSQKGYGFIQPEDGSKDVFVHISAVERSGIGNLREGQRLSFELERGNQGKTSAVDLREV